MNRIVILPRPLIPRLRVRIRMHQWIFRLEKFICAINSIHSNGCLSTNKKVAYILPHNTHYFRAKFHNDPFGRLVAKRSSYGPTIWRSYLTECQSTRRQISQSKSALAMATKKFVLTPILVSRTMDLNLIGLALSCTRANNTRKKLKKKPMHYKCFHRKQ